MEPLRPVLDLQVWLLLRQGQTQVTPDTKRVLVRCLHDDLHTDAGTTPVLVCLQRIATSLAQVYLGQRDNLDLPRPGLPLDMAAAVRGAIC